MGVLVALFGGVPSARDAIVIAWRSVDGDAQFEQRAIDGTGLWKICGKLGYLVIMGAYGDARAA